MFCVIVRRRETRGVPTAASLVESSSSSSSSLEEDEEDANAFVRVREDFATDVNFNVGGSMDLEGDGDETLEGNGEVVDETDGGSGETVGFGV